MDQRLGEDELEDKSFALVQAEDDRPKVSPGGVRPSLKDELDGSPASKAVRAHEALSCGANSGVAKPACRVK